MTLIEEPLLFKVQHRLSLYGGTYSIQKMLLLVWGESKKSKSFALSWPSCLIFLYVTYQIAVNDLVWPPGTPLNPCLHCTIGCFKLAQCVSPLSGRGMYLKNKEGSCLSYNTAAKVFPAVLVSVLRRM